MSNFKSKLSHLIATVHDAAAEAGGLKNQNLADILKAGAMRLEQAAQHPDVERVDADDSQKDLPLATDPNLQSGGNAIFSANDPGAVLQAQEAQRRAAFAPPEAGPAPFAPPVDGGPAPFAPPVDGGPAPFVPGDNPNQDGA